jgi:hypothetical protein
VEGRLLLQLSSQSLPVVIAAKRRKKACRGFTLAAIATRSALRVEALLKSGTNACTAKLRQRSDTARWLLPTQKSWRQTAAGGAPVAIQVLLYMPSRPGVGWASSCGSNYTCDDPCLEPTHCKNLQ